MPTRPELNDSLVDELNDYVVNDISELETVQIGCVVTGDYLFDFLICYGSIVDSWDFYPIAVNVFTIESEVADRIESFNLPRVRVHCLEHLISGLDWRIGAGFKVRLVEHSGLDKCIVTDVDNLFLAETPELWLYLENHDLVFIGAPHTNYIIQTSLWGFRRNAESIEFARQWYTESIDREFADASGLRFALHQNRTNPRLRIKALVRPKEHPEDTHHPCPYDIQANIPPFRLSRDALGFRSEQMGRAKVFHFGGLRARENHSVASRMTELIQRFPSSFEIFEYYATLANRAACYLGIPGIHDPLAFLGERIDHRALPERSHLRERLTGAGIK